MEDNVSELGEEIGITGLPNVMLYRDLKRVQGSSVIRGYKWDFKDKIAAIADYHGDKQN